MISIRGCDHARVAVRRVGFALGCVRLSGASVPLFQMADCNVIQKIHPLRLMSLLRLCLVSILRKR